MEEELEPLVFIRKIVVYAIYFLVIYFDEYFKVVYLF